MRNVPGNYHTLAKFTLSIFLHIKTMKHFLPTIFIFVFAYAAFGQTTDCSYTINPLVRDVSPVGTNFYGVTVTTKSDCPISAQSNDDFIEITSIRPNVGTSGQVISQTILFNTLENQGAARTGTITINGQVARINQVEHINCSYTFMPSVLDVPSTENVYGVRVTTIYGCPVLPQSNDSFIDVGIQMPIGGTLGQPYSRTILFRVNANREAARTGTIIIGNQTVTVNQAASSKTRKRVRIL